MRSARIKPFAADADGTYYHLVNRVSGSPTDYPFGEIESGKDPSQPSQNTRRR